MASLITKQTPQCSIADLFELPLLTIFDHLPLLDLFHIDEVCRAWQELKRAALLRRRHLIITNNNQFSLPLLDSPYHRGLQSAAPDSLLRLVKEEEKMEDDKGTTYWPYWQIKVGLDRHVLHLLRGGAGGDGDGDEDDRRLETQKMDRLAELLPNLTVLCVALTGSDLVDLQNVKQLLAHYRHQLLEVTLCFRKPEDSDRRQESSQTGEAVFASLLDSLRHLTALRTLEVNFQSPPDNALLALQNVRLAAVNRPRTLFRFEAFAADAENREKEIWLLEDILQWYGMPEELGSLLEPTLSLEPIELYCTGMELSLRRLVTFGPGHVSAGLRLVAIADVFGDSSDNAEAKYKALAKFARQAPNLVHLTVSVKRLESIRKLVEALARPSTLRSLVHLTITAGAEMGGGAAKEEAEEKEKPLPSLPSVKSLTLTIASTSHRDYEQLHLERLFPNAQVLLLNHIGWSCRQCNYQIPVQVLRPAYHRPLNHEKFKSTFGEQLQECLRLVRTEALLKMPKLTALQVNIRPMTDHLPFKNQLFTSRESMAGKTEFVVEQE